MATRKPKPVPILGTNWMTNLGGLTTLIPVALAIGHAINPAIPGPDVWTAIGLAGAGGAAFTAKDFNK